MKDLQLTMIFKLSTKGCKKGRERRREREERRKERREGGEKREKIAVYNRFSPKISNV